MCLACCSDALAFFNVDVVSGVGDVHEHLNGGSSFGSWLVALLQRWMSIALAGVWQRLCVFTGMCVCACVRVYP